MFEPTGLFRTIDCPLESACRLLNCIFSHAKASHEREQSAASERPENDAVDAQLEDERPAKRLRFNKTESNSADETDSAPVLMKKLLPDGEGLKGTKQTSRALQTSKPARTVSNLPHTATIRISPPPIRRVGRDLGRDVSDPDGLADAKPILTKRKYKELKTETLNPRLVPKPPATHAIRHKLLGLIHEQLIRVNKEVQQSADKWKDALELTSQELISQALDEEERAAKSNASVYANVLKLRIVALKKMKLAAWKELRLKQITLENPGFLTEPSKPKTIQTGLSADEEIAMLPNLVTPQAGLAKFGYVLAEIPNEELEEARRGVETARGWEVCDRCSSRFQVFPGRREDDGALTSGGRCRYHWGKRQRRPDQKDLRYTCCDEELGTRGCETAESHVFKVTDAKRLALILPFATTPTAGPRSPNKAVCFDCEMGYTTLGMEMIRITATSWPVGTELLDVLVRPVGEILDLNSRFSGVWHKEFTEAAPYEAHPNAVGDKKSEGQLRIVGSPAAARDLLFAHLTTKTPLIGHALENDLNAVRIIHPTIIDTVMLFPHRRGLPMRHGLKALVKEHLKSDIQMGGAQGHDSKEDARAAGELVRFKVAEKWNSMKREGWQVDDGVFYPPQPV